MKLLPSAGRQLGLALFSAWLALWAEPVTGQTATEGTAAGEVRIVMLAGTAEISTDDARNWVRTQTNQVLKPTYRVRTRSNSRVTLRWSDQSKASFGPLTEIEILPSPSPNDLAGLRLISGLFSFFHRDKPGRIRVITRGTVAGVEGTEFVLKVENTAAEEELVTLWMIDGKVRFSNDQGTITLTNGLKAVAEAGKLPIVTERGFIANNVLQWCFYYPAVLDLHDLTLTPEEEQALSASLAAYRTGDLPGALAKYPAARKPASSAEKIYYAAVLLSVGQVEQTEPILAAIPTDPQSNRIQRLAGALRQLIAAVKRYPVEFSSTPELATEFLAASYYEQSRAVKEDSLKNALRLARQSVSSSPQFGFAWERVAELEFSFGRTQAALDALNESLTLAPTNAQALALKGFLLAAQNRTREAIEWFGRAIAADPALGNAWLGRGLCRIRRGDLAGGREDLLLAAALEPQRSLLRSYLGKAYANAADMDRARHELRLAKLLDPADPTAWLYSALLNQQHNRFNEGIRDLEESQERNENRRVYRSQLLLDQDRAVRSSGLAGLYQDTGMPEVGAREAARAVNYDYANYSSHLFLAESFNALRDPTRFNLRYETVWFSERLLANLLSPAGSVSLSQNLSQQEYSRLFERDRLSLTSFTEYRSDGQVRETVSHFGSSQNTSYAIDLDYQHNKGVRPNNELSRLEVYGTFKQQLTAQDSVLLLTKFQDYHSGDNFQYYDPASARPQYSLNEYQTPGGLFGGYHREWSPGVHTLILGGLLRNSQHVADQNATHQLLAHGPTGALILAGTTGFDVDYRSQFDIYSGELNQIIQGDRNTLIAGVRYQGGTFDTANRFLLAPGFGGLSSFFASPPAADDLRSKFERWSGYGYWTWQPVDHLFLTPGFSYDVMTFPQNHRHPPVTSGTERRSSFDPKAAVVWSPLPTVTLRGVYTRSLGGVSFDESYRLEPAQLAGFSQAFRTVIPESVVGSVSAPAFETAGAALDLTFASHTYVSLEAELLRSKVQQTVGVFESPPSFFVPFFTPSALSQSLNYEERSFTAGINQLISKYWSFGVAYKFSHSELLSLTPDVPVTASGNARRFDHADLHQTSLFALYNHGSGLFARSELDWFIQNSGFRNYPGGVAVETSRPSEEFPQFNLFVGYRFPRQRGEFRFGVLNLTGEDYRLNPLSVYNELPRERLFTARLILNF